MSRKVYVRFPISVENGGRPTGGRPDCIVPEKDSTDEGRACDKERKEKLFIRCVTP